MIRATDYAAIVLDLDGTLVDDTGLVHPHTLRSLHAVQERGVRVMVATGRSELATMDVVRELRTTTPAVVFNGAGIWCPSEARLLEERVLSNLTVARTLEYARREDLLCVAILGGKKFSTPPRNEDEAEAIRHMHGLRIVEEPEFPTEYLIRLTLFSTDPDHEGVERDVARFVGAPVYMTSFPLAMLAHHRNSPMSVIDVHPPCRGKGEALRFLEEVHGVDPRRVVAVGDAMNDVPMLEPAGLAVAMARSTPDVLEAADRVIGDNNSAAIGELVDELFGL